MIPLPPLNLSAPDLASTSGQFQFGDVITGGSSKTNPFDITSLPHIVLYAGLAIFSVAVLHKIWKIK